MSFQDKVIIVTGSSSGIGAAIAIKFAQEGANVVIVGRKKDKLKYVAAKCGNPLVIAAEVTKLEDCKRIIDETIARFGRLDVLVNNAGIYGFTKITDENAIEVFDQTMATNLRSAVILTHLAAKHLMETKGNIINISSILATRLLSSGTFSYCASKAGMDHFTRAVALDLSTSKIRVNTVNPGPVKTDLCNNALTTIDETHLENKLINATALKRISDSNEIAHLVLFLADDTKAAAITGSSFYTDNGILLTPCM